MRLIDVVQAANDAAMLTAALTPLIAQATAAGATEVSDEALALARAGLGDKIAALAAQIDKARADAAAGKPPAP